MDDAIWGRFCKSGRLIPRQSTWTSMPNWLPNTSKTGRLNTKSPIRSVRQTRIFFGLFLSFLKISVRFMPVPTKILIVRFSSLGDLILTTPFIREARHLFKEAKLDLLTAKEFSPLFAQNPHLNQILTYDRKAKESLGPLAKQIRAENYDLVFDLHRSPRSTLLLALAFGPFSGKVKRVDKRSLKRNLLITFQLDLFPEV